MTSKVEKTKIKAPELRFPGFEGEWEEKRLGEVYSFRATNSLSRDRLNYVSGNVKNIHYGDIHTKFKSHFDVTKEKVPFINSGEEPKHSEVDFAECGDLILADASEDYADIGKGIEVYCLDDQKVLSGLHTLLLRVKSHVIAQGFMGHFIKSPNFRLSIKRVAQGTKVLGISKQHIQKITFHFPTTDEQQKIASFLAAADEWIGNLKAQKQKWEEYKKGMMQKIFSREIRFKDEDGNDFPDWEEKRLGEVGRIVTGKTPSTIDKKLWVGDVLFVTPTDILDDEKYQRRTDRKVVVSDPKKLLPSGSVLYTCIASIGKMSLSTALSISNQQINALVTNEKSSNEFVYYALLNETPRIKAIQANTTLPIINKTEFSRIKVQLPSLPEQQKIAGFLSMVDEIIHFHQQRIAQAEKWKKGLMQRMFV